MPSRVTLTTTRKDWNKLVTYKPKRVVYHVYSETGTNSTPGVATRKAFLDCT